MSDVHVVVPAGGDDPARVSGGNRYDRRLCHGLRATGWTVAEIAIDGAWPWPGAQARNALARSLDALPDAALVLVDGLIASAAGAVLVPRSDRLRLVVLVHMIFGDGAVGERHESAALGVARAVITTSNWTRRRLIGQYALSPARVHVAHPGTEPAPVRPRTAGGERLLCVGTLSALKGQDVLLEALADVAHLSWHCTLVGPKDRDPRFVTSLAHRAAATGIADRVRLPGLRTGTALEHAYGDADLLVVPSRTETYGMVVTEALAAGLPVLATAVGGIPEAVGDTASGVPGLLVPPEDHGALATALARWLTDAELRGRLQSAALLRRATLPDWRRATERVGSVLAAVCAEPDRLGLRVARRDGRGPGW